MSKKILEQKVEELHQQVQEGIEAQYQLGWCYQNGKGVEKDHRQALECWKRAAVLGHTKAKYFWNELMEADIRDNADVMRKGRAILAAGAAAVGERSSPHDIEFGEGQYYVAECYHEGKCGVSKKNALMAVEWWKRAAQNGVEDAIHKLALCYRDGYGVEQADAARAVQWFEYAASKGHAEARYHLAECLRFAQGGTKKNLRRAVELYELAATEGNLPEAQNALGHVYSLGEKTRGRGGTVIPKDAAKGAMYWKMAAEQGHKDAQINLAMCYRLGWGVGKDYYQAVIWLHKAVQLKCKKAGHNDLESLVQELSQGKYRDGNHEQALEYCRKHGLGGLVNKNSDRGEQQQQAQNHPPVDDSGKDQQQVPKAKKAKIDIDENDAVPEQTEADGGATDANQTNADETLAI